MNWVVEARRAFASNQVQKARVRAWYAASAAHIACAALTDNPFDMHTERVLHEAWREFWVILERAAKGSAKMPQMDMFK